MSLSDVYIWYCDNCERPGDIGYFEVDVLEGVKTDNSIRCSSCGYQGGVRIIKRIVN